MRLSFRLRILLTLLPLLALLALIGGAGAGLLVHLGGRIDAILKENYESVRYMQELREALEEIDSSLQLALFAPKTNLRQVRSSTASGQSRRERSGTKISQL